MIRPAKLCLREIRFRAGNRRLIDDVSLDVAAGEFIGLLGPNGAGKSTLLRTIYGRNRPDGGQVFIDGIDAWTKPRQWVAQRVAAVLQDIPTDFALRTDDIIAMGRVPHKGLLAADNARDRALMSAAITLLELQPLRKRLFRTLSGGERQRVLLARALVQQPRILILDEPTNHLDIHHQLRLLRFVSGLGVTVVAALHDLNLASMFCDRLCLLQAGKLVASGTPEAVLTPQRLGEVYDIDASISRHPKTGTVWIIPY
ncbi:ABC transporter ATP-binding protein [Martelella sp. HB161492]|uniref:ABC transporter ATP-binding protein n=1 Tax=Martelella sp. HB161492 TaxID=2720726 RepID=UPI001590E04A|nr:ABC transporter ATP-binding protein [Martelella sp. HB161492]